jgi:amidohydrolase
MTILCISLLCSLPLLAADEVDRIVDRELEGILEIYRSLHRMPELSYQEKETASFLAGELRELGFEVTERVGIYEDPSLTCYGVVAVLRNGEGPVVMLRTDLDGLPVEEKTGLAYASRATAVNESGETVPVMHACGHDLHMSAFLLAARVLTELRERWSGTLVMIGQPAEEVGAGAKAMLADGLYERFPKPDYVLAIHDSASLPAGMIGWREGFALASVDSVDVTVYGAGGHGAYPHATKDPIVLASQIVLGYQTIVSRITSPLQPAVVTVGSIHGGTKHNIIPDEVSMQLTVRAYDREVRDQVIASLERIARGHAIAAGLPEDRLPRIVVSEDESTPSTYNDPELVGRLVALWRHQLGEELLTPVDPVMAGEDFSRYTLPDRSVPTAIFWVGAVDPERFAEAERGEITLPSLHSPLWAPLPGPAIRSGARALATAAIDLMPLD